MDEIVRFLQKCIVPPIFYTSTPKNQKYDAREYVKDDRIHIKDRDYRLSLPVDFFIIIQELWIILHLDLK